MPKILIKFYKILRWEEDLLDAIATPRTNLILNPDSAVVALTPRSEPTISVEKKLIVKTSVTPST